MKGPGCAPGAFAEPTSSTGGRKFCGSPCHPRRTKNCVRGGVRSWGAPRSAHHLLQRKDRETPGTLRGQAGGPLHERAQNLHCVSWPDAKPGRSVRAVVVALRAEIAGQRCPSRGECGASLGGVAIRPKAVSSPRSKQKPAASEGRSGRRANAAGVNITWGARSSPTCEPGAIHGVSRERSPQGRCHVQISGGVGGSGGGGVWHRVGNKEDRRPRPVNTDGFRSPGARQ